MRQDLEKDERIHETELARIAELKARLEQLNEMKAKKNVEFEERQMKYLTEKDEPIRIEKTNANLKQAVDHLKSEIDGLQEETQKHINNKTK